MTIKINKEIKYTLAGLTMGTLGMIFGYFFLTMPDNIKEFFNLSYSYYDIAGYLLLIGGFIMSTYCIIELIKGMNKILKQSPVVKSDNEEKCNIESLGGMF